jgi:Tfp pilus assembly protein PilO
MKELFNLLEDKEKKTLRVLIVFLAVAMLFLLLVSLPMKRNYVKSISLLETKQSEYKHFSEITQQKENEWHQWQAAFRDIDDLKKSHFYSGKDAIKQMRLDIQHILNRARIPASQKKYNYTEFKKEKIKKMSVSFNVRGNYQSLKRFIQSVEEFPKFLIVEKVDFLDIDEVGSVLELKIILAGYYES